MTTNPAEAREGAAAAIRRLRDAAAAVLAAIAEEQPVAPHHLMALRAVAGGARTPSDVAGVTDRHVSSVSRVVDQLVAQELLERHPHPEDRRQVLVTLTTNGHQLIERFERLDHTLATRLVEGFDEQDAQRLAGYLDRLATAATTLADELEEDPSRLDRLR